MRLPSRASFGLLFAVLMPLAACGGGGKAGDLAVASFDLSSDATTPVDLTINGDAAMSTVGIACGTTPCAANAQYCCTDDEGKTGTCGFGSSVSCGASVFYCDGPEDCPPAEHNCCVQNGASQCGSSPCGNSNDTGYALCHTDADCSAIVGDVCCPSPTLGRYSLCLPGSC
jgi:hypothetical protein